LSLEALTNSIHAAGYMFTPPPNKSTSRQTFLPLELRAQIASKNMASHAKPNRQKKIQQSRNRPELQTVGN